MTGQEMRCCAAEAIGTGAILFFGCGSIAMSGQGGGAAASIAINGVFGLTVAAMIYALGHISCAHFNPAVTLGFVAARRFPPRMVLPYILAQSAGATAGCGLLRTLLPAGAASAVRYGATVSTLDAGRTIGVEAVLTFFLMLVIIAVATDSRAHSVVAGAAIGGVVTLCGIVGGGLTGCSMNPARSLAPALFTGGIALSSLWLYVIGSVSGAVLAAVTYERLRAPQTRSRVCPGSCCAPE